MIRSVTSPSCYSFLGGLLLFLRWRHLISLDGVLVISKPHQRNRSYSIELFSTHSSQPPFWPPFRSMLLHEAETGLCPLFSLLHRLHDLSC
jgi:hypothetical protein